MRTSHTQFAMMVEFMERNGDLSKPSGGPRGRHYIQVKWKELAEKLNCDGTGDSRPEEKWRKVWSDLKNNTKKKWAKIYKAASGTGGGPALQLSLTDLESRVLQIIGVQAATGMAVGEAGFAKGADELSQPTEESNWEEPMSPILQFEHTTPMPEDSWNTPGTSQQPTVAPPFPSPLPSPVPSPTAAETHWQPAKKKRKVDLEKVLKECEENARQYARERERIAEELERERIRQRDVELQLQAQWLEFMKEALKVLVAFLEKRSQ